jgi:hypothetical protein
MNSARAFLFVALFVAYEVSYSQDTSRLLQPAQLGIPQNQSPEEVVPLFNQIKDKHLGDKFIYQTSVFYNLDQSDIPMKKAIMVADIDANRQTIVFERTNYEEADKIMAKEKFALSPIQVLEWNYKYSHWTPITNSRQGRLAYIIGNSRYLLREVSIYDIFMERSAAQAQLDNKSIKQDSDRLAEALDVISLTDPEQMIKTGTFDFKIGAARKQGTVDQQGLVSSYKEFINGKLKKETQNSYIDEMERIDFTKIIGNNALDSSRISQLINPDKVTIPTPEQKNKKVFGLVCAKTGDFASILAVYEGFPAVKAGLKSGFKVIEINGISMKDIDQEALNELLNQHESMTVRYLDLSNKENEIKLVRDYPKE